MNFPPRSPKKAFTLIELLTVLAVIAVLASILVPVAGKARKNAGTAQTVNNLRQVYGAFQLYANENGQKLPVPREGNGNLWSKDALFPYLNDGREANGWEDLEGTVFTSPNAAELGEQDNSESPVLGDARNQGFGMNTHLPALGEARAPSYGEGRQPSLVKLEELPETMLIMDCNAPIIYGAGWFANQFTDYVANRHDGQNTVLFCDGHVETIPHERFSQSAADPLLPFNGAPGSTARRFWGGF